MSGDEIASLLANTQQPYKRNSQYGSFSNIHNTKTNFQALIQNGPANALKQIYDQPISRGRFLLDLIKFKDKKKSGKITASLIVAALIAYFYVGPAAKAGQLVSEQLGKLCHFDPTKLQPILTRLFQIVGCGENFFLAAYSVNDVFDQFFDTLSHEEKALLGRLDETLKEKATRNTRNGSNVLFGLATTMAQFAIGMQASENLVGLILSQLASFVPNVFSVSQIPGVEKKSLYADVQKILTNYIEEQMSDFLQLPYEKIIEKLDTLSKELKEDKLSLLDLVDHTVYGIITLSSTEPDQISRYTIHALKTSYHSLITRLKQKDNIDNLHERLLNAFKTKTEQKFPANENQLISLLYELFNNCEKVNVTDESYTKELSNGNSHENESLSSLEIFLSRLKLSNETFLSALLENLIAKLKNPSKNDVPTESSRMEGELDTFGSEVKITTMSDKPDSQKTVTNDDCFPIAKAEDPEPSKARKAFRRTITGISMGSATAYIMGSYNGFKDKSLAAAWIMTFLSTPALVGLCYGAGQKVGNQARSGKKTLADIVAPKMTAWLSGIIPTISIFSGGTNGFAAHNNPLYSFLPNDIIERIPQIVAGIFTIGMEINGFIGAATVNGFYTLELCKNILIEFAKECDDENIRKLIYYVMEVQHVKRILQKMTEENFETILSDMLFDTNGTPKSTPLALQIHAVLKSRMNKEPYDDLISKLNQTYNFDLTYGVVQNFSSKDSEPIFWRSPGGGLRHRKPTRNNDDEVIIEISTNGKKVSLN